MALSLVWMYIALVGAVAFVLIQLWLLVFFARSIANKINQRIAEGGKPFCWYGGKRNFIGQNNLSFPHLMHRFIFLVISVVHCYAVVLHHSSRWHHGTFYLLYRFERMYFQQNLHRNQRCIVCFTISHIRLDMLWTKYYNITHS